MRRRDFIKVPAGSLAVWPLAGVARQRNIGVLVVDSPGSEQFWKLFQMAMSELGYVERCGILHEFRSNQGQTSRLPELAAELVRLNVNLIATWFTSAAKEEKESTCEIPIVMALAGRATTSSKGSKP